MYFKLLKVFLLLIVAGAIYGLTTKRWSAAPAPPQARLEPATLDNPLPETKNQSINLEKIPCAAQNLAEQWDCYENHYRSLVKNQSVAAAFQDLRARYNGDSYTTAQCHPITHIIGQAATEKYSNVSEAYRHGDSFCWSGYYHGVLEGISFKVGKKKLLANLNAVCDGIDGKEQYSFDYFNCVHGLGHGLMAINNDELFESLALCDSLTGSWEKSSCYGGVFMENIIIDNKNHFTKYLKPDDPLYPCNAATDQYKHQCFLMQTSYMLKITNSDWQKVFDLCATAEAAYRPICYQSLGRDASGRSASNLETTKATCYIGKNFEQRSNCIVGATKDFISYFHSDQQARKLCAALSPDLETVCLATAEEYYKSF